jgi:phosphatidylserine/phosphatidylglycerophosphate/cardiolipin synthase-like enzyme
MHNKFIIVDGQELLTGSMNFGNGSIFDDYNNIVIIEDASLANTYTIEFEEMWGGNGAQPNLENSKFGPDKSDNTFHSFLVGSTIIESYFSPTDNTTAEIVNAINSADHELDIAMFTFIHNDIGDAVIAAKNRGVYVRCIIENVGYFGSEYNGLVNAGIAVLSHESVPYDFHHKYCIIDAQHASSDPQVVTGSHNWTNSAEEEYDENTLIIHDHLLAQQYTEEFFRRWSELGGASINEFSLENEIRIFPNPSTGSFTYSSNLDNIKEIKIVNSIGCIVEHLHLEKGQNYHSVNLPAGVYTFEFLLDDSIQIQKLIIQ